MKSYTNLVMLYFLRFLFLQMYMIMQARTIMVAGTTGKAATAPTYTMSELEEFRDEVAEEEVKSQSPLLGISPFSKELLQ